MQLRGLKNCRGVDALADVARLSFGTLDPGDDELHVRLPEPTFQIIVKKL